MTNQPNQGGQDQKHLQLGLTFDLKFVKLHGGYAKEDDVYFTSGIALQPTPGADADAWMLGVTVPLLGGSLLGSYQTRDGDDVTVCLSAVTTGACPAASTQVRQADRDVWAIGYTYPLSRRTNLYINFSDSDGEGFINNSVTLDRKQYTVGVRHLF